MKSWHDLPKEGHCKSYINDYSIHDASVKPPSCTSEKVDLREHLPSKLSFVAMLAIFPH